MLFSQRDFVIEQLKESVSEYVTINQVHCWFTSVMLEYFTAIKILTCVFYYPGHEGEAKGFGRPVGFGFSVRPFSVLLNYSVITPKIYNKSTPFLYLFSRSGEGSFMNVDMTLALAPEHSVSLREELGILSEDQVGLWLSLVHCISIPNRMASFFCFRMLFWMLSTRTGLRLARRRPQREEKIRHI